MIALACAPPAMDGLGGLHIIGGLRVEDVRHEALRIAVVERKERRLDLHHDAVPRLEIVIHVRQREAIALVLPGVSAAGLSKPET